MKYLLAGDIRERDYSFATYALVGGEVVYLEDVEGVKVANIDNYSSRSGSMNYDLYQIPDDLHILSAALSKENGSDEAWVATISTSEVTETLKEAVKKIINVPATITFTNGMIAKDTLEELALSIPENDIACQHLDKDGILFVKNFFNETPTEKKCTITPYLYHADGGFHSEPFVIDSIDEIDEEALSGFDKVDVNGNIIYENGNFVPLWREIIKNELIPF